MTFVSSESSAGTAMTDLQFILYSLKEAFEFIPTHWRLCPAVTQHMVLLVYLGWYNGI